MGRGKSAGQPLYFQCSACRKRKGYPPNRLWDKGLILDVTLTGKTKAIGDGNANGRSSNTRVQYKCDNCGHIGWSRHVDIFRKAQRAGIPTAGSEPRKVRKRKTSKRKVPKEGDKNPNGREFVAGRWRTVDQIHGMACHSVVEQLKLDGPLSRDDLVRKTGLAEIRAQRAIETCLKAQRILNAGQGRYYVAGEAQC